MDKLYAIRCIAGKKRGVKGKPPVVIGLWLHADNYNYFRPEWAFTALLYATFFHSKELASQALHNNINQFEEDFRFEICEFTMTSQDIWSEK